MTIYTPFTYIVGWSDQAKYYYGVRYAKECDPNDLWTTYFTSSKYVQECREQYGEPDVIEVRRIFDCKEKAVAWEEKVLRRLKVRESEMWLNRNDCAAPPVMRGEEHPLWNVGHSDEAKRKIGDKNKGKLKGIPKSPEHIAKIAEGVRRRWQREGEKEKLAERMMGNDYGKGNKGWNPSDIARENMSKSAKKRNKVYCSCILCKKIVTYNNIGLHYKFSHS